jgi:hypothetical protein
MGEPVLTPVTKYTRLRHKTRDPQRQTRNQPIRVMFSKTLAVVICTKIHHICHVSQPQSFQFTGLRMSHSVHYDCCPMKSYAVRLPYIHTNVSQENSAVIFRAEEYFNVDDNKASHSTPKRSCPQNCTASYAVRL